MSIRLKMNNLVSYIKSIGYLHSNKNSLNGFCEVYTKDGKKLIFGKSLKGTLPTLLKPSINVRCFIRTAMGKTVSIAIDNRNPQAVNDIIINNDPEIVYNSLFDKSTMIIFKT